ncbi:oligomeric, coiled-coil, peripheral membrane protein [Entomortierella lignicola]|nr:oligomeric, coiled-coil, peripheral membrane protein [Entomortierella lignicola]
MVYNREVLTTDISSSILTLTEQAKSEPVVPPLATTQLQAITIPTRPDSPSSNREWGSQYQRTFEVYVSNVMAHYKVIVSHAKVCDRIMEELRVQALAVRVALTNLDAHSQSVLETFEKFNVFATKEFTKQAKLLQSFPRDIEALRQIKVHPALLPADSPERYISDLIPTDKLVLWAERCREIHENLLRDGKELSRSIKEVQEGTSAIRGNSGINLDQLEDAMADILQTLEQQNQIRERVLRDQSRVKERLTEISRPAGFSDSASTLEALVQLANVYITDYIDSSRQADDMLRDKLSIFISAKRSQTANLISQLMHISKLQSTIASIPPSLSNLDDALRKRDVDFSQLVYVQRIPIAYGALIVEIVRRREYAKLFVQKSQQLGEVMYRFRQIEQRRRDSFRSEVAKFVPVVVPGLDDTPPFCEINTRNTQDRLPAFTRDQVVEFERLVNQLSIGMGGQDGNESHIIGVEQSNVGTSSISSGQETNQDSLSKLRATLAKMTAQMDVMGGEFDRILEKSFLMERIQKLEEDNAKLRADVSRVDIQQRSGTPQLAQHPFPRIVTPTGATGSITNTGTGNLSAANAPTSPKLTRQPSRGSTSTPTTLRGDADEQNQLHQNQRLIKENSEMATKIKAYEARIRSLEEKLYQHFHAGSSIESSVSSKDSRQQQPISTTSDQPWKTPEDIQVARSLSQAKDMERRKDEERLVSLERELQDISLKLEQTQSKLREEESISQKALATQEELHQELLELKLQSATQESAADEGKVVDILAAKQRSDELEDELKGLALKYEKLMQHHEREKEDHLTEVKAFKDRIDDLTSQLVLGKEILEGQLEQAKLAAEQASDRAKENEELQNMVLELEDKFEHLDAQHKEVTARAEEQEKQFESHRAVYDDILAQLKDQERKTISALEDGVKTKEEFVKLQEIKAILEKEHETLLKTHADMHQAKDELAQQTETLRKQITDLEAQREAYKVDVNLRLEEAKTMVRRAEEDWKEKSRLLDQMERAIKDLSKPIKDSLNALGLDSSMVETSTLDQVHRNLLEIEKGIKSLVRKHHENQTEIQKSHSEKLSELSRDHQTSMDILNSTIDNLKKAHLNAEKGNATLKAELDSTITLLKEELENVRVQQRASAIPVPVSTTPTTGAFAVTSTSPVTSMSPSLSVENAATALADKSNESFSTNDRIFLSALALDLGIPLPLMSARDDSLDSAYPTSSVLLDHSEKRTKFDGTLLTPQPVHVVSSSAIATSSSGTSRSSSTTIPLSRDILQTFNFSDLNVAETTVLIKKKLTDTEHLLKRWQRECKHLKEKYNRAATEAHEKIAFRNFKVDDLTLFLPTRNSISKPWAAFNINFPHYFLQMTPSMANQLRNREWIVARITSIAEAVVDKRLEAEDENGGSSSSSNTVSVHNPFGLADGVKYYLLEATSWNGSHSHSKSSSYHSSSGRESSSSKLRHHSSTSVLNESSTSSKRDHERSKERRDREQDTERRKLRERSDDVHENEGSAHLVSVKEDHLAEASLTDIRGKVTHASGEMPSSPTLKPAAPSTAVSLASSSSHSQSKQKRLTGHSETSLSESLIGMESSPQSQLPPIGQTSTSTGNRSSVGASGSAPITIPFQSAATNALRAISSSVGSTGSGGSGSISSLLAHHLGSVGSGTSSATTPTLVASSPPTTMVLSSSPLVTGVSTISAMGTTVSVNNGAQNAQSSQSQGVSATSPNPGTSSASSLSSLPAHPSRLSTSSNRDDIEQLAVFATDEEQEEDRQQQQRNQRDAFNRTSSSSSAWRG